MRRCAGGSLSSGRWVDNLGPVHILLVGGGHTHALVLRHWDKEKTPDINLTLVNPEATAPYTGMLPGHVAGHYPREALDIDLVALARHAGARLVLDRATGIDADTRQLHLESGAPVGFDLASLNIGIRSTPASADSFGPNAVAVKPLGPFAEAWRGFLERRPERPAIAVVGGGVGGAELAMAMAHRLGGTADITLIEAGEKLLRAENGSLRRAVSRHLHRRGVTVRTGLRVESGDAHGLRLEGGETLPADFIALAAGAHPSGWIEESDLATEHGFVAVDEHLRSLSHPDIFAAGDIAHLTHAPRPKAGVYAVREAPHLAANLIAAARGEPLQPYTPQGDYLRLVTLGAKRAIASKWGLTLGLPGLWHWKDRIDRSFMDGLRVGSK